MEVVDEAGCTGERTDGGPESVLESAPGGEVVLDCEVGGEVGEEGEEVEGGVAFGFVVIGLVWGREDGWRGRIYVCPLGRL